VSRCAGGEAGDSRLAGGAADSDSCTASSDAVPIPELPAGERSASGKGALLPPRRIYHDLLKTRPDPLVVPDFRKGRRKTMAKLPFRPSNDLGRPVQGLSCARFLRGSGDVLRGRR